MRVFQLRILMLRIIARIISGDVEKLFELNYERIWGRFGRAHETKVRQKLRILYVSRT